jgi:hypothetical protein
VLDQAGDRLPGLAAVRGAEQHPGRGAEPELAFGAARFDVPGLAELELAVLREAEALRALPRPAQVGRALHGAAVDEVVRGGVDDAVVEDGVEDRPPGKERPLELPAAVASPGQEETLSGAGQDDHGGNLSDHP